MTLSEVAAISGEAGNFDVTVKEQPRYVDMERCIACGECERACPKGIPISLLNKKMEKEVKRIFEHVPGTDIDEKPMLACFAPGDEKIEKEIWGE